MDRLLSTSDVSQIMGTSRSTACRLFKSGLLKLIKFGRTRKVREKELDRFLKSLDNKDFYEVLKGGVEKK